MALERNHVSIALVHNRLGSIGFESTRGNDFPFEDLAQLRRRNRCLPIYDEHVAFDLRFNNVEECQSEPVQLLCNVIEECGRVAVRHRVPRYARSNTHSDAIAAPHRYHCFHYFQQEAKTVLDRPTIGVGALVATILQELIGQIAVGGVKFDPVKARSFGSLGSFAIVLDDARDFFDVERPMRRGLGPTAGRGNAGRRLKPVVRSDGRRRWRRAVTTRVPEL
jgi:hypothetical protein